MKRARTFLGLAAAAALAALSSPAVGQCSGANRVSSLYGGTLRISDQLRLDVRPDLSNPGARSLAIGGAFISSADDATSVVANPAGLGSIVRPTFFVEARPSPVVQYDRFDKGKIDVLADRDAFVDKSTSVPFFASGVIPVGDKLSVAAFYQRMFWADRNVDRIGQTPGDADAGPCFETINPRNGLTTLAYAGLYDLSDKSHIDRFGASIGFRLTYKISLGATVFLASEKRDQVLTSGWPDGVDQSVGQTRVKTSSNKAGFIVGAQFTPSEAFRLAGVYSEKVAFSDTDDGGAPLVKPTLIPRRAGFGVTFAPSPKVSFTAEGVWVETSQILARTNLDVGFQDYGSVVPVPRDRGFWSQNDTWEVRLGAEYSVVQTRTRLFVLRAGYWMESPSNIKFTYAQTLDTATTRAADDFVRVIFPNVDDPWLKHVTFGLGAVFNKKFQIDVGGDYEFETKRFVASALAGYVF